MQVKQQWFLDFLGQPKTQFTIPRYQRVYSWLTIQCEELWEDLMRVGKKQESHFVSTTLYLDAGTTPDGTHQLDLIDGQQRIASTTVLLTALRDYLRETDIVLRGEPLANQTEPGEGIRCDLDAEELNRRFLTVQDGETEQTKIWLIGPDRTTLAAFILGAPMPSHVSVRVRENYEYFAARMREDDFDPQILWNGLRELLVVAAELDGTDKAQPIFESLNTKGLPLTAADLMRNYLLVAETHEEQQRLYQEYWQPMEVMFRDDESSSGSLKLNTGLRTWLTIRLKNMSMTDRTRTFHYFKRYMNTLCDSTAEELLDEMRSFCYLWAENYKMSPGRAHCSRFEWAKKGQNSTLAPNVQRQADIMKMLHGKSREERILEQQRLYGAKTGQGVGIAVGQAAAAAASATQAATAAASAIQAATAAASQAATQAATAAASQAANQVATAAADRAEIAAAQAASLPDAELTFQTSPKGYELTQFGAWGNEPITWRVLERKDDSVLLITEKCIDAVPYHSAYVKTTWADCFLREWANSMFVDEAFTAVEAKRLMVNTVHTADDYLWKTVGGPDCEDRVYLLSAEEALDFFADAEDRMAEPTDYAREEGIFVEDGHCLWWLRSPGHYQGYASIVWPVGGVDTAGSGVGRPGMGFRPVIRVRL